MVASLKIFQKSSELLWQFGFLFVPLHRVREKDSRMMLNSSSNYHLERKEEQYINH